MLPTARRTLSLPSPERIHVGPLAIGRLVAARASALAAWRPAPTDLEQLLALSQEDDVRPCHRDCEPWRGSARGGVDVRCDVPRHRRND